MRQMEWKRAGMLLKADLLLNWKSIAILFLVVVAAVIVLMTACYVGGMTTLANLSAEELAKLPFSVEAMKVLTAMGNSSMAVSIASLVVFSRVFSNIEKRSGEIRYLLLPATNLEKWLSRVIYVTLVGFVVVEAAYYAGMFIWYGAANLLGAESTNVILDVLLSPYQFVKEFGIIIPTSGIVSSVFVSMLVYAFYVFCGTIYRHYPWLYTLLWGLAIYVILIILTVAVILVVVLNGWWVPQHPIGQEPLDLTAWAPWLSIGGVVSLILTVLLLWFSYKKFCKRQLESKKIITV